MSLNQSMQDLKDRLKASDRMPVVFLGHGSPMNAIEDNAYSRSWKKLGQTLPRPQAILVVSAHWMTEGTTLVDVSGMPRTIHDFYGFPPELYAQDYPAKGAPDIAREVQTLLASHHVQGDDTWGLDHGAWSVLTWLYPDHSVPVFQLSIDMRADFAHHVQIGRDLADLRNKGVLILGSGNVVHNLRTMRWGGKPYDWAIEFDQMFAQKLTNRDFGAISNRTQMGALFQMAQPTVDHYLPALTIAGAADAKDKLIYMNASIDIGSVSMRSFVFC